VDLAEFGEELQSTPDSTMIGRVGRTRRRFSSRLVLFAFLLVMVGSGSDAEFRADFERSPEAAAVAFGSTYDFDLGFRPLRDGFSFANYGGTGDGGLTESEIRELLGDSAVCAAPTAEPACVPREDVLAWVRGNREMTRAGHCEGISALSLAMFVGLERADDYGADQPFDLTLEGNDALQRRIDGWHATQFTEPTRSATVAVAPGVALGLLEASFEDVDEVYTIGVFNRVNGRILDGHTVVPYAIDADSTSTTRLYVYDSNLPGEERFIEIDDDDGTWSYQGAATYYDGSVDLQLLSLSARLKEPRRPVPLDDGRGALAHATCVPE